MKEYMKDQHMMGYYDSNYRFQTADDAFKYYYDLINDKGVEFDDTRAVFNTGFYILSPSENIITPRFRGWTKSYAELEWSWYLSGDPNAHMVAEKAKIWNSCMDEYGNVNSNYGYIWKQNDQLNKVINMLNEYKETRRASISLYDGKLIDSYERDTVCTYAINFMIVNNMLNMSVLMRSCDLWYGFCNDQYCFSKLFELVHSQLNDKTIDIGTYYHFCQNLHLYKNKLNKNK